MARRVRVATVEPMSPLRLSRMAHLRCDRHTRALVLVAPERALVLDASTAEIVLCLDGTRNVEDITAEIAEHHGAAPEAAARDVETFLDALLSRGLLEPGAARPQARTEPVTDPIRAPSAAPRDGTRPFTLVAELTHRCPLRCPYCSNPTDLTSRAGELDTETWRRLLEEAEALGVLAVHFTGGEPLLRADLEELVARARGLGLYTSLVTSGIPSAHERFARLAAAGLDHVELSVQHAEATRADAIAGAWVHARKLDALRAVKAAGLPVTLNVVLHRENVGAVDAFVALAEETRVDRLALANVRITGWARVNEAALLPSTGALERARERARSHAARLRGRVAIVFEKPEYASETPSTCTDGWGRHTLHVTPDGRVLPCAGAATLGELGFERFRVGGLARVWKESPGLRAFRGEGWMQEPCRSCPRREEDHGGCRCKAFAVTGDARRADPSCTLAPDHGLVLAARARAEGSLSPRRWLVRGASLP